MERTVGLFIFLLFGSMHAQAGTAENIRGLWMLPRMNAANTARADVTGGMKTAPEEVWRMPTGGEVGYARAVTLPGGRDAALIQTGANLELTSWDGTTIWRHTREDVRQVMHVGDFDGDGSSEVMALSATRRLSLFDLATGKKRWSWESPPSSAILRSQFLQGPSGIRFITFPTYSVKGYCFDFSKGIESPALVWERDYAGKYTAGYGPGILLADMDGDGRPDIVLSSKHPEHGDRKTCYQAVIDADTGLIRAEINTDPDTGAPVDLGRPYGFLKAADLDGDGLPEVTLASCQVEEYLNLTRNAGARGLEPMWGAFVEKDWPVDDRELRPQVTSLADVNGDGRPELVVGLWDAKGWKTAVIDPLKGFESRRAVLDGMYFWGCHDVTGDGRPEIIVSAESKRLTSRFSTLRAVDGAAFGTVASLSDAAVFVSGDSDLPEDTDFKALRRNPVSVSAADGVAGILVRRYEKGGETGVFLWGGKPGGDVKARRIDGPGFVRVDLHDGVLLLTDSAGTIRRYDRSLKPVGRKIATNGRSCFPLVWSDGGVRELVVPMAGGRIAGIVPDLKGGGFERRWEVRGSMHALHRDGAGVSRLAVADMENPDRPAAVIHRAPVHGEKHPVRIPLAHPPYIGMTPFGDEYRLLVNLSTGVHTNAFACFDAAGGLLWESPDHGAHPRLPAVADLGGDREPEIVADDHGEMRIYSSKGALIGGDYGKGFILPAYVLPIAGRFAPGGDMRILGVSGFGGIAMRTADTRVLWKIGGGEYRYYWGLGAVGDVDASGMPRLGIMAEDGSLECIDAETGAVRWSVNLGRDIVAGSVIAADVDGDGRDEFIAGMPDGRLVAVGERGDATGAIVWEKRFPSAVTNPVFADVDGDGKGEIVVSTSDGYVRVLK